MIIIKIKINIKLINDYDIHLMGHRGPRIGPVHPPVDQGDQEERAPKHQVSCCHYCVPVQNLLKVTRELNETFYRIYQKMELHFDSLNVLSFQVLPVILHLRWCCHLYNVVKMMVMRMILDVDGNGDVLSHCVRCHSRETLSKEWEAWR